MAEIVEDRRRSRGLSIDELARRADLTREQVTRVRKGDRRRYDERTIDGIAVALDWQLDWYDRLLAGEEPVEGPPPWPITQEILRRRQARLDLEMSEIQAALDERRG